MTFDPTPRPASQRLQGAATAHMLITRAAEAGRSADAIEARQEELLGQFPDAADLSPGEREWLTGYRDEAAGTLATLRDVERADAGERAALAAQREPQREADREAEAG